MKVLITGGTGFVGSHTTAAVLSAGHTVRLMARRADRVPTALDPLGVDPSAVEVVIGDVTDETSVRRALEGCNAVIHAGSAYAYALPLWRARALWDTNVQGSRIVLGAAQALGLDPIVYVSSSWALVQHRASVVTEDTEPARPPDAYPRSKVEAERIARAMQRQGAPVVITYPAGVWGPHDPHWGETAQLVESLVRGRIPFLPDGRAAFSDVREVAALHAAVLTPRLGPRRYLVPSHSPRFSEVVRYVAEAAGCPMSSRVLPNALILASMRPLHALQAICPVRLPVAYAGPWYITRDNAYGVSRATHEFGLTARPFTESVRDTVAWMRSTGKVLIQPQQSA